MVLDYAARFSMIDKLTAPMQSLSSGFDRLTHKIEGATRGIQRMGNMSSALNKTTQRLSSVVRTASKLGAISGISVGAIGANAVNSTAKFEDIGAVLETLEGSSEKAEKSLAWVKKFTKETPFGLENTAEAFTRLKAYGLDPVNSMTGLTDEKKAAFAAELKQAKADQKKWSGQLEWLKRDKKAPVNKKAVNGLLKDANARVRSLEKKMNPETYAKLPTDGLLTVLGDTGAAMGKDIMAAVEMMADAIVGENERLKEFGVRGAVNKKSQEIEYTYTDKHGQQQMLSVDKNDREGIQRVLMSIFSEKYAGAMEKRSKTFNGILANMADTVDELQGKFMQAGPFNILKKNLQNKLDAMNRLSDSGKLERWGRETARYFNIISQLTTSIKNKIMGAMNALADFVGGWKVLGGIAAGFASFFVFKELLVALALRLSIFHLAAVGVAGVFNNWQTAIPAISRYFPALGAWLGDKIPQASARFTAAMDYVKAAMRGEDWAIGSGFSGLVSQLGLITLGIDPLKAFSGSWQWFKAILKQSWADISPLLSQLKQQFLSVSKAVGNWLQSHQGSIQSLLSAGLTKVLEWLSRGMAKLESMANSGRLGQWLDETGASLGAFFSNLGGFINGVVKAGQAIGRFLSRMADFLGGWDKLGMVFAGGFVISALSGFLGGLAAIIQTIAILGSGLTVLAGLTAPMLGIVAAIAALIAGVAYLWLNWDGVKASLQESSWGQVLLTAINTILSPIETWQRFVGWLGEKWQGVKAYFSDVSWADVLSSAFGLVMPSFSYLELLIKGINAVWELLKNAFADVSWSKALEGVLNRLTKGFEALGRGWDKAKSLAGDGWDATKNLAGEGWDATKSFVNSLNPLSDSEDGKRATGGPVRAGSLYRINEFVPEVFTQAGKQYLMPQQSGYITPLTSLTEPAAAAPAGIETLTSLKRAEPMQRSHAQVDVRIQSDQPVTVERISSKGDTELNVDTGRFMA